MPGFHFVSAENAFDGDAQKITLFSEVNIGEGLVFKLHIFLKQSSQVPKKGGGTYLHFSALRWGRKSSGG